MSEESQAAPPYRTDLINAAIGAKRDTNEGVAKRAEVSVPTVSRVRNGDPNVGYVTLKRVVEAVGLTVAQVSTFEEAAAA